MPFTRAEISKRYKLRHPDRVRMSRKNWFKNNPDKAKAFYKRKYNYYKSKHPEIGEVKVKNPDYYVGFFKEAREYIRSLKSKPCMDCGGIFHPVSMDFDHVRGVKVIQISKLVGCNKERILAEVSKCDVVCSNCHRVRTYNRIVNKNNAKHI